MARPWIAPEIIAEIKRLLKTGISQRAVAKQVGVSRGTVGKISAGQYKPPKPKPPPADGVIEYPDYHRPPKFCPVCRAKVYMPCLACQIRALREEKLSLPIN